MRLKVLRVTKRAKDAVRDIDYADKLNEAEREWMEVFINAHYSNDTDSQFALARNSKRAKEWGREVSRANNAFGRDLANKFTRLALPTEDAETGEEAAADAQALTRTSENFTHYKCTRCLKKAPLCQCPAKRAQPYGIEDYIPAETSFEDAMTELDQLAREKAYDLLPYGTNPEGLKVGHKVVICLPHHYLKDRTGTVLAYRKWTNEYLIEADRPGLKHRDGSQSPTTLCWVRPEALKRPKLFRA
jgi:hypothetical protein